MTNLSGTWVLLRLALRTDRVRLPLWILGILALVLVSAVSVIGLYSTDAEIATYVALIEGNATMVAVNGPGIGFDDPNVGVIFANETTIWAVISVALMNVFLLIRHTRGEEDAERAELLRARMLGRHAQLAAASVLVGGASLAVGVLCLVGLVALGLAPMGSIAFCATMVLAGVTFAAVAAVAAQVSGTARAALGMSLGTVGAAYVLRAAGDVGDNAMSWVSPIGWAHRVRPYAGEQWWVLALFVVAAVALGGLAVALFDRRDLGAGLRAQRAGPAHGSRWASRPLGLAMRLQRGSVIGWSVGLAVLGVVYGSVGRDVEQMFADNPDMEQFIAQMDGASITDSYLSYTLLLGAMMAGGYAIAAVLRLRGEEAAGRAEPILTTPTRRWRWTASHLLVAVTGTAVVLFASGLGTGVGLAASIGEPAELPRMVVASLSHLPAVYVLVGVGALLFGAVPRWTLLAWAPLALVVIVGLFGELFQLPQWVRSISPFEHSSGMPAASFDWVPAGWLLAVAAAATASGIWAFSRRDVPSV